MAKTTPIKVIKRDDRNRQAQSGETSKTGRKTPQQTARDMVNTVTNWVNELQQKRRLDRSRALQTLFPDEPQATEA